MSATQKPSLTAVEVVIAAPFPPASLPPGKSDPGDARVLSDVLRTDAHLHRQLPAVSERASAVKVVARQFYPNALAAFPVLTHKAALTILAAVPTPQAAQTLTRAKIVALLRRCGRRNQAGLAETILEALRAPALRQSARVEAAFGAAVAALLPVIIAMQTGITALEDAMTTEFAGHDSSHLLRAATGLGPILAARVLGEIDDDPTRFDIAQGLRFFAGTAPITKASGRSKVVRTRHVRNRRLGDACHWWAFASITKSAGARDHYDRRRASGDSHNAALLCATSPTSFSAVSGGACTTTNPGTRPPPGPA